jgi:hypothetical protein
MKTHNLRVHLKELQDAKYKLQLYKNLNDVDNLPFLLGYLTDPINQKLCSGKNVTVICVKRYFYITFNFIIQNYENFAISNKLSVDFLTQMNIKLNLHFHIISDSAGRNGYQVEMHPPSLRRSLLKVSWTKAFYKERKTINQID